MNHGGHRLTGDFRITVRHSHRGFFMDAGDELRLAVHSVIDDGFLQSAERGAGARRDIIDVQGSEAIDHEIAADLAVVDFGRVRGLVVIASGLRLWRYCGFGWSR